MPPKQGRITVATCQFPVSKDLLRNSERIRDQVTEAKNHRADVAHFPETALPGYCGTDLKNWDGYPWDLLRGEVLGIMALAKKKRIWVVLGTAHPLSCGNLPHNSLYAISPKGELVDRYDKRFCTSGDLKYYSPGNHFTLFEINGVKCGMLICYDVRFPEIYRAYKRLGAQLIFHSFYNARAKGPGIHGIIMRPTLQARAASNYLWVSASNSSAYYAWPSVLIQPDGRIVGQLRANRSGVLANIVDVNEQYYDASAPYRDAAMDGVLNSGVLVEDPRSDDRWSV